MKKVISYLNFIVVMLLALLLSGCWNYREINELNVVAGFAVDKSSKGDKYLVTSEVVDIKSGMGKSTFSPKILQAEGETLFDAIRNMIKISDKKLYFSHAKVFIISQEVAKEGISQIIDWVIRDTEPRIEINFVISGEKTAGELLQLRNEEENINSFIMYDMLKAQKNLSKAPFVEGYKLVQSLTSESLSSILPTAYVTVVNGEKTMEVSGTAVFKKDKLIGFLDGNDTKYLLFIRNLIKGGILPEMQSDENVSPSVALEIFDNKTKINPEFSNGKLIINLNVKTSLGIGEHGGRGNFIDKKGMAELKKATEKSIEKNIIGLIQKVQDEYASDIFGFGESIKNKMPSTWRSISADWDDLFKELDVNVKSEVDIRSSGFINKPIENGE